MTSQIKEKLVQTVSASTRVTDSKSESTSTTEAHSFEAWETDCLARLFSALGDPTRLTILRVLKSEGTMCVSDLATVVHLSVSAVSHQLRLLRDRELITAHRNGRTVEYSISDDHVSMILDVGLEHAMEDCPRRKGAV